MGGNIVGGDPESFSDTELVMQEITDRDMHAGLAHLMEPMAVARRKRQTSSDGTYHGFQATVSQAVAESLVKRQRSSSVCTTPTGVVGARNRLLSRSPSWGGLRSEPAVPEQSDSSTSGAEDAAAQVSAYSVK